MEKGMLSIAVVVKLAQDYSHYYQFQAIEVLMSFVHLQNLKCQYLSNETW